MSSASKKPKSTVISIRLPHEQREAIERAAVTAGTTVSAYVLASVADAIDGKEKPGRADPEATPPPEPVPQIAAGIVLSDPAALAELKRIGININQIAHSTNAGLPIAAKDMAVAVADLLTVLGRPEDFRAKLSAVVETMVAKAKAAEAAPVIESDPEPEPEPELLKLMLEELRAADPPKPPKQVEPVRPAAPPPQARPTPPSQPPPPIMGPLSVPQQHSDAAIGNYGLQPPAVPPKPVEPVRPAAPPPQARSASPTPTPPPKRRSVPLPNFTGSPELLLGQRRAAVAPPAVPPPHPKPGQQQHHQPPSTPFSLKDALQAHPSYRTDRPNDSPHPPTRHELQIRRDVHPARPAEGDDKPRGLGLLRKLWGG